MTTRTEKQNIWQRHIESWISSGQTQAGYCREHNLKPHQFIYWRSKFCNNRHSRQNRTADVAHNRAGFIVANVEPRFSPTTLTLQFPNGVRLEGICTDNADLSYQLIEVLK